MYLSSPFSSATSFAEHSRIPMLRFEHILTVRASNKELLGIEMMVVRGKDAIDAIND